MAIHESGENYLEAILMITEQQGSVRSIDVVNHLGFSKPTVSVAVHTLERDGYLRRAAWPSHPRSTKGTGY